MADACADPARRTRLLGLVPIANVADVQRTVEFYRELGFSVANTMAHDGVLRWAWLSNGNAHLMVSRSAGPMNPGAQHVLFYLYAPDLVAYRDELIAKAVSVSAITHPPYMKAGEFRIDDPDGYALLVGQADKSTQ